MTGAVSCPCSQGRRLANGTPPAPQKPLSWAVNSTIIYRDYLTRHLPHPKAKAISIRCCSKFHKMDCANGGCHLKSILCCIFNDERFSILRKIGDIFQFAEFIIGKCRTRIPLLAITQSIIAISEFDGDRIADCIVFECD